MATVDEHQQTTFQTETQGNHEVGMSDFLLLSGLGFGVSGKVFLVRKLTGPDAGRLYALKQMKKEWALSTGKRTEHALTEREVLETVKEFPFLATMRYAFQTESLLNLVLDFEHGGELHQHLLRRRYFCEADARIYLAEITLALQTLHDFCFVYRDLKPENILLDASGHIVLTDFGLCKDFRYSPVERAFSFCGTYQYMAPEVIQKVHGHNTTVDWWSLGVLAYELVTGTRPFDSPDHYKNSPAEIFRRIRKEKPMAFPRHVSYQMKDFIRRLLHKDPSRRLGARGCHEIKSHRVFEGLNWTAVTQRKCRVPIVPALQSETDVTHFNAKFAGLPVKAVVGAVPTEGNNSFQDYAFTSPSKTARPIGFTVPYETQLAVDSGPERMSEDRAQTSEFTPSGPSFIEVWDEEDMDIAANVTISANTHHRSSIPAVSYSPAGVRDGPANCIINNRPANVTISASPHTRRSIPAVSYSPAGVRDGPANCIINNRPANVTISANPHHRSSIPAISYSPADVSEGPSNFTISTTNNRPANVTISANPHHRSSIPAVSYSPADVSEGPSNFTISIINNRPANVTISASPHTRRSIPAISYSPADVSEGPSNFTISTINNRPANVTISANTHHRSSIPAVSYSPADVSEGPSNFTISTINNRPANVTISASPHTRSSIPAVSYSPAGVRDGPANCIINNRPANITIDTVNNIPANVTINTTNNAPSNVTIHTTNNGSANVTINTINNSPSTVTINTINNRLADLTVNTVGHCPAKASSSPTPTPESVKRKFMFSPDKKVKVVPEPYLSFAGGEP